MKKLLLATTALVGAFSIADASATPTVTLGGVADFQVGHTHQDSSYRTTQPWTSKTLFASNLQLNLDVEGKADNGLGYGGRVVLKSARLNNYTSGTATFQTQRSDFLVDQSFLFVDSEIGRLEMGSNSDVAHMMKVDASTIARASGGIDGDWDDYVVVPGAAAGNRSFTYAPDLYVAHEEAVTEHANRLSYFSPRMAGFQVGLSYTPDLSNIGPVDNFGNQSPADRRYEQVFGVALNYTTQIDQIGLSASATGEFGEHPSTGKRDLEAYAFGASASYMGFSLAGSWGTWNKAGTTGTTGRFLKSTDFWTVGGSYEQGPVGVSVGYMASTRGHDLTGSARNEKFDNLVVSADYQLAPGFMPFVEWSSFDFNGEGTGNGNDNDGNVFMVGAKLSF